MFTQSIKIGAQWKLLCKTKQKQVALSLRGPLLITEQGSIYLEFSLIKSTYKRERISTSTLKVEVEVEIIFFKVKFLFLENFHFYLIES